MHLIPLGGATSARDPDTAIGDLRHQGLLAPRANMAAGSSMGRPIDQGQLDQGSSLNLELGKTPINVEVLCNYLQVYPNKQDASLLSDGFRYGFRLGFDGEQVGTEARNLKSARLNPVVLKEKFKKEILLGRFAGPFKSPPINNLKISPVGLIPKTDGTYRLITHLSHPEGTSVNDGISDLDSSVSYTTFDKVADMIFLLGKGSEMAKRDIKSAFRLLPISPEDFWLLGVKDGEGLIYIDKFLPLGCKSSCALFEKFATFLHWLVAYLINLKTLDHYLDDFIFAGVGMTKDCSALVDTFTAVCDQLSVPIAIEKSVNPCTCLIFLGFDLDSVNMTVSIPLHKVEELLKAISEVVARRKVTLKEFQSVVGKLSFFSKAIRSGRAFLRRFYDAMSGIKRPHHRIRISASIRKDLDMWLFFF